MNNRVHDYLKNAMFDNPFFLLKLDPRVSQDELKGILTKYQKRASLGILKDPYGNVIDLPRLNHLKNMLIQNNNRTRHRFFCLFNYLEISKCNLEEVVVFIQSSNSSTSFESFHDYVLYGLYLLSEEGISPKNEKKWIYFLNSYHKVLTEKIPEIFSTYGSEMKETVNSSKNYFLKLKQELESSFTVSMSLEDNKINQDSLVSILKVLVSLKFDVEDIIKEFVEHCVNYIEETAEEIYKIISNVDKREDVEIDVKSNLCLCQNAFSIYKSNLKPIYIILKQNLKGIKLNYFQECCNETIGNVLNSIAIHFTWANEHLIYKELLEHIVEEEYFNENSLELNNIVGKLNKIQEELYELESENLLNSLYSIFECAKSIYDNSSESNYMSLNKKEKEQLFRKIEQMYKQEFLIHYESCMKKYKSDQEKRKKIENYRARCLYEIACGAIELNKLGIAENYLIQSVKYVQNHELLDSIEYLLSLVKHKNKNMFVKLYDKLGIRGIIFLIILSLIICSSIFSDNGSNDPTSNDENSTIIQDSTTQKDLKKKLKETKEQLDDIDQQIDDLDYLMEQKNNEIDSIETDINNGIEVDRNDYENKINSYNADVEKYKSLVKDYNDTKDLYNEYVHHYNSLN
ncbi:hypothetical protein [Gottfriedia acidiceleris]|uniref:Uncharacterized protein n=1 Tax=Gottfriedia acidiceleris TaxID=371036 RepID=A0ABY4JNS8_9BACI|nr:hypothetical protein [Gottfriedia acidiceleris]UPM55504.1 hypothetical protein MY490_06620 [Gottfriedia acidiceleris]